MGSSPAIQAENQGHQKPEGIDYFITSDIGMNEKIKQK